MILEYSENIPAGAGAADLLESSGRASSMAPPEPV